MRRLYGAKELLDGALDQRTLRRNLEDLERVNRWLDGAGLSWRAIRPLLRGPRTSPVRLLDVGTGLADIPVALLRSTRARRAAAPLEIVATDIRPEIVDVARTYVADVPDLHVRLDRPDRLADEDRSFDIVHASLVVHHLDPPAALELLAEMARVARVAVVVNDLDRQRAWLWAAWLLTRILTRNEYTRHDAPLSVWRAYRPDELTRLARRVGLREIARYWARPPYRYALVFVPER